MNSYNIDVHIPTEKLLELTKSSTYNNENIKELNFNSHEIKQLVDIMMIDTSSKEPLTYPLQTQITLETTEFKEVPVEEVLVEEVPVEEVPGEIPMEMDTSKLSPRSKFKRVVRKVIIINRVFNHTRIEQLQNVKLQIIKKDDPEIVFEDIELDIPKPPIKIPPDSKPNFTMTNNNYYYNLFGNLLKCINRDSSIGQDVQYYKDNSMDDKSPGDGSPFQHRSVFSFAKSSEFYPVDPGVKLRGEDPSRWGKGRSRQSKGNSGGGSKKNKRKYNKKTRKHKRKTKKNKRIQIKKSRKTRKIRKIKN